VEQHDARDDQEQDDHEIVDCILEEIDEAENGQMPRTPRRSFTFGAPILVSQHEAFPPPRTSGRMWSSCPFAGSPCHCDSAGRGRNGVVAAGPRQEDAPTER
jgi:hypothetical protein